MWSIDYNDNELYHHGIKGMKWGIRRTDAQLGHEPVNLHKTKKRVEAAGTIVTESQNINKSTVSSSNSGVSIVIHNNYYGNQTTSQIKETNNDLVRKINKVLFDNDDRDRRVSLG